MRPLTFFDYLFYRIAYFYANHLDYDDIKEYAGSGILGLLQLSNALFIIFLIKPIDDFTSVEKLFVFLMGYLITFGFNLYRYKKIRTYKELDEKWKDQSQKAKKLKTLIIIGYVLLSIILLGEHRIFNSF
ncbi:hypothetical protein [Labilibaculum euxinus]|uniref:Uncharacterized protein n=1 Tax=Labilibaculum euxinus TaxID=2686357 RepID=A0A7M4D1W6_9BACT|nr:hypothetical protein [Labilibaculum euxinus]MUP36645.1 hypothetical protein [Labilibaculum euxinus]MVB05850.1 hypothetical protein [Labilibaculum euxinus]